MVVSYKKNVLLEPFLYNLKFLSVHGISIHAFGYVKSKERCMWVKTGRRNYNSIRIKHRNNP